MTDSQNQIDSRWLIYADGLHVASNMLGIWFFGGPVVGGIAYAAGLDLGNSIALATFVSIFGTSLVLELRSRKVKRVVNARVARRRAAAEIGDAS